MTTSKTKTWLLFVAILLFCHHSVIFFHQIRKNVGFCRMARRLQMVFHEQNVHEERENQHKSMKRTNIRRKKNRLNFDVTVFWSWCESHHLIDPIIELNWKSHHMNTIEQVVVRVSPNPMGRSGQRAGNWNRRRWWHLRQKWIALINEIIESNRLHAIFTFYMIRSGERKLEKNGKNDVKKEATMAKVVTNELRCWRFEMQGIHSHVPTLLGYPEHFSLARYVRMRNCRTKPVVCADDGRSRLCEADVFTVGTIRYNTWSSHVNINY